MRFDIVTVFPEAFNSYFNTSIIRRARESNIIDIRLHALSRFSRDPRRKVDDRPYGGGAGMVLMAEPILNAVHSLVRPSDRRFIKKKSSGRRPMVVIFSAKGKQFTQRMAYRWATACDELIMIAGRYEGIDERVKRILRAEEISIGPYVLTDGEVVAMAVVSAVTRLLPGAIAWESVRDESHFNTLVRREKEVRNIKELEYPHYTRPEVLRAQGKTYRVPRVLLSGDHARIEAWRNAHRRRAS